ncbi:MAG: hypothetical protein LUG56_01180 [Lachnospiraceae bacterium]|nr:hypothetical protein [Lachnospiraceae bacterium]
MEYFWYIIAAIGKRFGRHKLTFGLADHKKSREGSAAMLCTAFLAIFITLTVNNILLIPALAAAILGAIVGAFAEAVTKNGYDTVSVPCAAAVVIWVVLAV